MTSQTIEAKASTGPRDLFGSIDGPRTITQQHTELEPHKRAIQAIERVLLAMHPVVAAWSSGKDSSAAVNLLFNAALNLIKAGHKCPQLVVSHADTGVEAPTIRALADSELRKMKAFAKMHGIPLVIHVGRPSLSACFATRIIGGRALPPFPQSRADCSTDWKIMPTVKNIREVVKRLPDDSPAVVTLLGTRSDESLARKVHTAARKETAHEIWYNEAGEARLSPILDWDTDDVWIWLGESGQGLHPSYSDFQDTLAWYADAGATSCAVVADLQSAGQSKGCGSRGGCWSCTKVKNDRSVENMIGQNPKKYPYLVPLLELRDYVAHTQWDWSKRNYIGRTISLEGKIKVGADQYSPQMVEDLLYFTLAAQDLANELGAPSVVRPVGIRELFAIDFYWSARAWHPPFHALAIYLDHEAGNRRFAPKVDRPCRPSPVPVIGEIHVGSDWDSNVSPLAPSGLRHPVWEIFSDSCGPSLRTNKAGKLFLSLEEADEFDVDEQGASDFLEFFSQEFIDKYHRHDLHDWTLGASTYLSWGFVTLASGQSSSIHSMMLRSQWLQGKGLHGHQTPESLRSRCCSLVETQSEMFA